MTGKIDARLAVAGIELPQASAPAANYLPFAITGNLVFLAGQVCQWNGQRFHIGRVGAEISVDNGIKAARMCGQNLLAHLKAALGGDLDRVVRCVRLGGFVNSAPDFFEQPKVVNGCSDLMVEVFGDAGRHARTAVGVNALPFNMAVEVDAVFEIRP